MSLFPRKRGQGHRRILNAALRNCFCPRNSLFMPFSDNKNVFSSVISLFIVARIHLCLSIWVILYEMRYYNETIFCSRIFCWAMMTKQICRWNCIFFISKGLYSTVIIYFEMKNNKYIYFLYFINFVAFIYYAVKSQPSPRPGIYTQAGSAMLVQDAALL